MERSPCILRYRCRHARLLNFVDSLLRISVERFDLGMVFREVVAVRLSSRNVFLPDLAFYRKDRLGLQRDNYIAGAPDLAIEVLSPHTAHRDVSVKFVEYEQHGVEEYWVLDPETQAHRFYARRGEVLTEFAAGEPVIRSTVLPGLPLRRAWLTPRSAAEGGGLSGAEHGSLRSLNLRSVDPRCRTASSRAAHIVHRRSGYSTVDKPTDFSLPSINSVMKAYRSASNAMGSSTLDVDGLFWLTENPDDKVHGHLRYDETNVRGHALS